jgi:hypothetical protein
VGSATVEAECDSAWCVGERERGNAGSVVWRFDTLTSFTLKFCPPTDSNPKSSAFAKHQLAYRLDPGDPPLATAAMAETESIVGWMRSESKMMLGACVVKAKRRNRTEESECQSVSAPVDTNNHRAETHAALRPFTKDHNLGQDGKRAGRRVNSDVHMRMLN